MTSPIGRALVGVGATIALIGTFLPWLASGSVDRSSYDLVDIVERLGFSSGGVIDLALTLWPIVPLLLVVSAVVAVAPRIPSVVGVGTGTVTGLYVGTIASAVLGAPSASLFTVRYGVWVSLCGSLALLAGTAVESLRVVRQDRPTTPEP
jgi:hypothetical protein